MGTPAVVFSMEFVQGKWHIGKNDFMDYMNRPEKFQPLRHKQDEYKDMLDYMGNDEKSDGVFDMNTDVLTPEQISGYRLKEMSSQDNDCTKYLGVMSFDNEFLKAHGIISPNGINLAKLKDIGRASMSELIETSDKLQADNVNWCGAIHTNTDNIHIHFEMFENYRTRPKDQDVLEAKAFDKAKSKAVNMIIGSEKTIELARLSREVLLPEFKSSIGEYNKLSQLAVTLPETGYYNSKRMKRHQANIRTCVNSIIESSPQLKANFDSYISQLDSHADYLKELYGGGKRSLYLAHKQKRLKDFYERAGNSLIKYIRENDIKELTITAPEFETMPKSEKMGIPSEKKNDFDDYDVVEVKRFDKRYYAVKKIRYSETVDNNENERLSVNQIFLSDGRKVRGEISNEFAQYTLGKMLYSSGKYQDKKRAINLLERSAEKGNEYAQCTLGKILYTDKQYQDRDKAMQLLELSADKGNENARKLIDNIRSGKLPGMANTTTVPKVTDKYISQKKALSFIYDRTLDRLKHEYDRHINQLKNEFDYEQDRIIEMNRSI